MKKLIILVLVFITFMLAACDHRYVLPSRSPSPSETATTTVSAMPKENLWDKLKLESLGHETMGDYIVFNFKVTNNSSYHTYEYVKVKLSLLDENDDVLTSDWTYAVSSEGLEPSDSQEFDCMIKQPSETIARFSYKVTDFS